MKANLDELTTEIGDHIKSRGLAVFHALARELDQDSVVYWRRKSGEDYRGFVTAAEAAGVKLIAVHSLDFDDAVIDGAVQRLHDSGIPRADQKLMEKRLNALRAYSGFTCQIELSFDLAARVYVFEMHTDWYDEMNDLIDEIEDAYEGDEDPDQDDELPPSSGYFSKN